MTEKKKIYSFQVTDHDFDDELVCLDSKALVESANLTCPICLNFETDLERGVCRHNMCRSCHDRTLNCPQCLKRFDVSIEGTQMLRDLIRNVKVKCIHEPLCAYIGSREDWLQHVIKCDFTYGKCVYCETQDYVNFFLKAHELECPQKPVKCVHCEQTIKSIELKEHDAVCDKFPVECKLKCGFKVPRSRALEHEKKECPNRLILCPMNGCCAYVEEKMLYHHIASEQYARVHVKEFFLMFQKEREQRMDLEKRVSKLEQLLETVAKPPTEIPFVKSLRDAFPVSPTMNRPSDVSESKLASIATSEKKDLLFWWMDDAFNVIKNRIMINKWDLKQIKENQWIIVSHENEWHIAHQVSILDDKKVRFSILDHNFPNYYLERSIEDTHFMYIPFIYVDKKESTYFGSREAYFEFLDKTVDDVPVDVYYDDQRKWKKGLLRGTRTRTFHHRFTVDIVILEKLTTSIHFISKETKGWEKMNTWKILPRGTMTSLSLVPKKT